MNEADIQRACIAHLRQRGVPGLVAFHVPMGGYRRRVEAAIFVGLGAKKGVSDLIMIKPPDGKVHALELKVEGKEPTKEQIAFLESVGNAGGCAAWAAGLDSALRQLEDWGLLVGRMT
jgi:hypothetical protein